MKNLRIFMALIVACSLVSCVGIQPKPEEVSAANYGSKPSKQEMVSAVKNYMSKSLIDPYSAVYSCSIPSKSWIIGGSGSEGNVQMGKTYFGYTSTCSVNAKNRFGGYTGSKESTYMIYVENGRKYFAHFDGYQEGQIIPE